ncbi:M56 family metallopeptidase [Flavobacterium stagni]|uniref:Peptidase M56 domain-containing protein n=1 Tax=Flavobacterium stagni TaxID=2506421 RepID=A0A4Q1K792_9FLAO|nr:M56 family metallopeptidase [Flavobacterium stagni]RXR21484.1 hypothetical protein EQG61_12225 [Flavobacterium stagni]
MEALFIYLLKSGGLLATFFLVYYLFLRKETFFKSNRWFLLAGYALSMLLPLLTITKTVWITRPKLTIDQLMAMAAPGVAKTPPPPTMDWSSILLALYIGIALVFIGRLVFQLFSVVSFLKQRNSAQQDAVKLVDVNESVAPFSFFNYIVINSQLYTEEERQSILLHEQIHSQQRHSIDVLIAHVICGLFWFNPFVWAYKKVLLQNLEYIADREAMALSGNPTAYQKALLKVAIPTHQLAITNPFYQSLIKKRILMLHQNQSHQRNSWKYTLMIPALVAFIFLFQIKTVAQEKETQIIERNDNQNIIQMRWDKNTPDSEMESDVKALKEQGVTVKYSKVKRNEKGEITGIKVSYEDNKGKKGQTQVSGDEPIAPIVFFKSDDHIGFGTPKMKTLTVTKTFSQDEPGDVRIEKRIIRSDDGSEIITLNGSEDIDASVNEHKIVVRATNSDKPMIIVDGKVMELGYDVNAINPEDIVTVEVFKDGDVVKTYGAEAKNGVVKINTKKIKAIRAEAMEEGRKAMEEGREEMRVEMKRAKEEMRKARAEMDAQQPELEKARQEMLKAKEEMLKAKAEMEKAKAEFEKAKANLKKG